MSPLAIPRDAVGRRTALADPLQRYARMLEIRTAEDTIFQMFASGAIHGTTHLAQGQEALSVGLASVTRPDDVYAATYRGHSVALALGLPPETMFAEIMGRVGGCTGGLGGSMHLSDPSIGLLPTFAIVGAGLPVAAGAALSFQVKGEDRIAVSVCGDGATNIGAFHESLNLAAIWKLPILFVVDNNVYGEYSRWNVTTPIEHLAERAASYGMRSVTVDGMVIDEVRDAVGSVVDDIRAGAGPVLVEAKTYRFAGHSRSDTAPYRPAGELERWLERDPVALARAALLADGVPASDLDALDDQVRAEVAAAVESASAQPEPSTTAMFAHVRHALEVPAS